VGPCCQRLRGWRGYRFGKEGKRAVGRKLAWAGVLPRGLFNFFPFLFLFFSVLLEFCLKTCKNFYLNLGHILKFVKLFFWYLKHTGKVFKSRTKQNFKKMCKCKMNGMHDMMHDFM
jgi:hypothetical protein